MSSSSTFWLVSELQTAAEGFATAASDPLSAVLLVLGALLVVVPSAVLGFLALGGALDAIGDSVSRSPPPNAD